MDKQTADSIITSYLTKIYGFSVKHSLFYNEAEELAASIACQLYQSLLKADEVSNTDGYVMSVCRRVYSKYVEARKREQTMSLDSAEVPYEESFYEGEDDELIRLRREIAYLTRTRREIVYSFYYESKSIGKIAEETGLSEGTVKWHLNKARREIKKGFTMERKIGKLGLNPITSVSFSHSGSVGPKERDPGYYLSDTLSLNIVYSVYHTPRTADEICEELGITPVFIEDKIRYLEDNGFLTPLKNGKYTTKVIFDPETYSKEENDRLYSKNLEAAELLVKTYVPVVREAVAKFTDVYVPNGNRELLEAAAIFYGVREKCTLDVPYDESDFRIHTKDGAIYVAICHPDSKPSDPEYVMKNDKDYNSCGSMWRTSFKYLVSSWSVDTRFDSREGFWMNNRNEDYDYLYEFFTGKITDSVENSEKFARLRDRGYITEDGRVNVTVVRGTSEEFFGSIPSIPEDMKRQFTDIALEHAMAVAKNYPPQVRDYIVGGQAKYFLGSISAMMVLDIMYGDGTFKALTEDERVSANLIMFADVLPE